VSDDAPVGLKSSFLFPDLPPMLLYSRLQLSQNLLPVLPVLRHFGSLKN